MMPDWNSAQEEATDKREFLTSRGSERRSITSCTSHICQVNSRSDWRLHVSLFR